MLSAFSDLTRMLSMLTRIANPHLLFIKCVTSFEILKKTQQYLLSQITEMNNSEQFARHMKLFIKYSCK